MKFSVIIPTYKKEKQFLIDAINSVLNQTYKNYEIIVVDDNEKDIYCKYSREVEQLYKNNKKIKIIYNNKNKGANYSRNIGIKNSSGEIISFLDSDDEWYDNYLEKTFNKMQEDNRLFCYSGYKIITKDSEIIKNIDGISGYIYKEELLYDRLSPTSCVSVYKKCFKKAGLFDEDLPARQDYDMWIRISKYYEVSQVPEVLVKIKRVGQDRISNDYRKRVKGTNMVYQKSIESLDKDLLYLKRDMLYYKNIYVMNIYKSARKFDKTFDAAKLALHYRFSVKLLMCAIMYMLISFRIMKYIKKFIRRFKYYITRKNKLKKIMFKTYNFIYDLYKKIIYRIYKPKNTLNNKKRKERIIVTMSAIPTRYKKVNLSIETMFRQTMKPDKIILYLDIENKDISLPKVLLEQQKRGLEICYVNRLKPHTKYFYAFKKYKKDIIITVDDDIYYPYNLIETLYKSYIKNKNCISCMRLHKITFNGDLPNKYKDWIMEYEGIDTLTPSHKFLATGVGGILYPPNILKKEWDNIENIKKFALGQDDIWLKYMEIINNVKVVRATNKHYVLKNILGTQQVNLREDNVKKNGNDCALEQLSKYYNIYRKDFEKN